MWLPAEHELLLQIIERPDDDRPRLVLADLLTDRGEALGELITVQCALARIHTGAGTGNWHALKLRERELLRAHGAEWHQAAAPFARELEFRRGLAEVLHADTATLLADGGLEVLAPVRELHLTSTSMFDVERILQLPLIHRLNALDLHGFAAVGVFAGSSAPRPQMPPNIRRLTLSRMGNLGFLLATELGWFKHIEVLELSVVGLAPRGPFFADRSNCPALERLVLHGSESEMSRDWRSDVRHMARRRPGLRVEWRGIVYDADTSLELLASAGPTELEEPAGVPAENLNRLDFGEPEREAKLDRQRPKQLQLWRSRGGGLVAVSPASTRGMNEPFHLDAQAQLTLPVHEGRICAVAFRGTEGALELRYEDWPSRPLDEVGLPLPEGLALRVALELAAAVGALTKDLAKMEYRVGPGRLCRDDVFLGLDGGVKLLPPFLHVQRDEEHSFEGGEYESTLGCPVEPELEGTVTGMLFLVGTAFLHLLTGHPPALMPHGGHWTAGEVRELARALRGLRERPLLPSMLDPTWSDFDALVSSCLTPERARQHASLEDFIEEAGSHPKLAAREQLAAHVAERVRVKESAAP